jgi:hypothetical protein
MQRTFRGRGGLPWWWWRRLADRRGRLDFDPAADALFARFTTPPTTARKNLINGLIETLKSAGVWAKLDALYVLASADVQSSQRNWKSDLYNLSTAGSPVFAADRGYTGSSSSLATGFIPSTAAGLYGQNSASAFVWSRTNASSTTACDIGTATGLLRINSRHTTGVDAAINAAASDTAALTVADSVGFTLAVRRGSANYQVRRNAGPETTVVRVSAVNPAAQITLLTQGSNFSARQIAAGGFGGALTDAEGVGLYNALRTYLLAVGAV